MITPLFDVHAEISKEFSDADKIEIGFEIEVDAYDDDIFFKYFQMDMSGNLFLNSEGALLEANTFYSAVDSDDGASYSESADESQLYFTLVCSNLLKKGGKFLFTFKNIYDQTVSMVLEIGSDYSLKTEFVDNRATR